MKWSERFSNGQVQSLIDADNETWNKAVDACIATLKTFCNDQQLIADMEKLKK